MGAHDDAKDVGVIVVVSSWIPVWQAITMSGCGSVEDSWDTWGGDSRKGDANYGYFQNIPQANLNNSPSTAGFEGGHTSCHSPLTTHNRSSTSNAVQASQRVVTEGV